MERLRNSFDKFRETAPIPDDALVILTAILQRRGTFVDEVFVNLPEDRTQAIKIEAVNGETGSKLNYEDGQLTLTLGDTLDGANDFYVYVFHALTSGDTDG